jgi:beta-glucanase (GH16 family)
VPKGYKLTFQDEFDARQLDLTKWDYRLLGERDGTLLSQEAVALDGKGNLLLGTFEKDGRLLCSMISTQKSFLQKYGYFESRIKFQSHQGVHGAFWLQSPTFGKVLDDLTASGAEIDIVEFFGAGRSDGGLQAAIHWNGYGKDLKTVKKAAFEAASASRPETSEDFHVFAVDWTNQGYRLLVDGVEFYRTNEGLSHHEEYVVLSLLSSSWERGRLKTADLPAIMTVDYVRVYAP